jgi:glycosyltransferase involved in cell wall biosynthesis
MPFFSVIIATRNRPRSFQRALDSVLAQSFSDMEIIIVNDGSANEFQLEYDLIRRGVGSNLIRSLSLRWTPVVRQPEPSSKV